MTKYIVEVVPVNKVWLGEGPHWDAKSQKLYYVDILAKAVHSYDPATSEEAKIVIQGKGEGQDSVSLVIPVENEPGKFVIGLGRSLRVLEWDGKAESEADTSNLKTLQVVHDGDLGGRFNDGKCDSSGRLWAGTMGNFEAGWSSLESQKGFLYKLERDGEISRHLSSLDIANGLAWSSDNKTFYYIDSLTYRVDAWDYDSVGGVISNRRPVFDFKANNIKGIPDGMCIDEKGNLWVALFSGGKIAHIDPVAGNLIDHIEFPATNITSVAFGGPNLDILYVTSAQHGLSEEELLAQPDAGSIFQIRNTGVKGLSAGVAYGGKV